MSQLSTYSGVDTNFAFNHPVSGAIVADGVSQKGLHQITIRMSVAKSMIKGSMDGVAVPSVIPGDWGEIELQVWQTSTIHQELLSWANTVNAAQRQGDVSQWFAGSAVIINTVDGTTHTATGIGPQKIPDKVYQPEAQLVTWIMVACDIQSE
jgi:hypothetical protein